MAKPRWSSWNVWVVLDKDDRYIFGAVVPNRGEHRYKRGETTAELKARMATPGNGSRHRGVLTLVPKRRRRSVSRET